MKRLVVVQARMGSTRLPGKVLTELGGRPALQLLLERLRPLGDEIVVATSTAERDDAVVALADGCGVATVRGSEEDVLARFVLAMELRHADLVVRITADCPLADPAVIADAISLHQSSGADYTSNTLIRTYPDGLDVEVVSAGALSDAAREATDAAEREHVTPFIYRRPERYQLAALWTAAMAGDERWTLDTQADLDDLRTLTAQLDDPVSAGWQEILGLAGRRARPAPAELYLRPDLDRVDPGARTFVLERDGKRCGSMQVVVVAGTGHLRRSVGEADHSQALALLRRALMADYQVRELVEDGPLA